MSITMIWRNLVLAVCFFIPSIVCQLGKPLKYSIQEELPARTPVGNIPIDSTLKSQYTSAIFEKLRYGYLPQSEGIAYRIFSVDEKSGVLRTDVKLDRDALCPNMEKCVFEMNVVVTPARYFHIIQVEVDLTDLNDNTPTFPQQEMTFYIPESRAVGATYSIPPARDQDGVKNSIQEYQLLGNTEVFELRVTPVIDDDPDIRLVLKASLDREKESSYQLKVIAKDGGEPSKTGSVNIHISITDVNDNNPKFVNTTYNIVITENHPVGSTIVQVQAHDTDQGSNGIVMYNFTEPTAHHYGKLFAIDEKTGEISVSETLDYEFRKSYRLVIMAYDQGPNSAPAQAVVTVTLEDANDNPPNISVSVWSENDKDAGHAVVSESLEIGGFVALLSVTDTDSDRNGEVNCSLNSPSFKLQTMDRVPHKVQYKVVTTVELDYENITEYDFEMKCQDHGIKPQVSSVHLLVKVRDENDHSPKFHKSEYEVKIRENNAVNAYITQVNASDRDSGESGELLYSIRDDVNHIFSINERTGVIVANVQLDRERYNLIKFHVHVRDKGSPSRGASAVVTVKVIDRNDEKPKFGNNKYAFGVFENMAVNTEVGQIKATDRDSGSYGEISYRFDPAHTINGIDSFNIDPKRGIISTKKVLDREKVSAYYLVVIASDQGYPPLTQSVSVSIFVADRNDNPPVIIFPSSENNTVYVTNEKPIDFVVTRIKAYDVDIQNRAKLSYSISTGNEEKVFRMHPITGEIHIDKQLDVYTDKKFELTIVVTDRDYPPQNTSAELNIFINKTGTQLAVAHTEGLLSGSHVIIVICLVIGSTVVAAILLVTIFILKRKERKPDSSKYRYGYKIERQIMLDQKDDNIRDVPVGASSSNLEKDNFAKEVHFNLEENRLPQPPSCSVITEVSLSLGIF